MLDTVQGPLPSPVRAELFGLERFCQHGVSLAQAQPVAPAGLWSGWRGQRIFFPRLRANVRELAQARSYLEMLDSQGEDLSPAGEWLLDNDHLIEAQSTEIRNGLPWGYFRALPKLQTPTLTGLPRVYGIAWAFVAHTDSSFDAPLLSAFLSAYQSETPLTLGELWAVPVTLRMVLLENLARLAGSVARHRAARAAADWCCEQDDGLVQLRELFQGLHDAGLRASFMAQLALRLRSHASFEPPDWARWLAEQTPNTDALIAAMQHMHAADNVSVRNAVTALHAINKVDWRALIERVSPVLQTLGQCSAFVADSDLTRDQCTHALERLSRRHQQPELQVARAVVALVTQAQSELHSGPAHWLIGEGQATLAQVLQPPADGNRPTWAGAFLKACGARLKGLVLRPARHWRGLAYATLPLSAALACLPLLWPAQPVGVWQWLVLPAALMLLFEALLTVLNRTLAESLPVHRLPRLALEQGLAPEHRTLVVVPCMLTSEAVVHELTQRLERHYLANPEQHARFALLSDWLDAPQAQLPGDAALLSCAVQALQALNQRYPLPGADGPRFLLLHRPRTWCHSEGAWIGWERKRGKLEALLACLATAEQTPAVAKEPQVFLDLEGLSALAPGVRYVLTLDSDTELPPRVLRELVAIAAHPLNQPRHDPHSQRVISGYGILQPHVAAPLPDRSELTAFGWLFSGPWGFDVYNAGSSEVYQDLFGQGSFCGKGLLDVQAVHRALQGRVPPGRLLSHDLYEGAWAGAAHLSDVSLVEHPPMHLDVAASRTHRWTRGDWQLLALVGLAVRGRVGLLNLLKMADNLRRSLLAPASVLLLWLSLAAGALAPGTALALVVAAVGLGPLVGAMAALLPSRQDLAWMHFFRAGAIGLARTLAGTVWTLATLPHAALLQLDAIARALWRMLVSHRRLLQWTTAAQAQAQARQDWAGFWRRHARVSLFSLAWLASGLAMPQAQLPWLWAIGLVWALAPAWLWLVSQPLQAAPAAAPMNDADRADLQQLALQTWRFFEATVTAADHHLPPDNLQFDPAPEVPPMLARRTSPTNVGLYLCSCLCARQLDLIDTTTLLERLRNTLDTLDTLPRWQGHFHNWVDTATCQPLPPAYVSTVDSGNLVACLWAVAQGCLELSEPARDARTSEPNISALRSLAERLQALAEGTQFAPLYDRQRRLLHLGYNLQDASLDPSYYDLLASESRLTSFVAIAKGDLPPAHWQALGRPFLAVAEEPTLRSWSGSMFEYLMPSLWMREPEGSLLQRVSRSAVQAQRDYGAQLGIPWGISESAYFQQDSQLAFQYGPFGVPQLALRRTPQEDQVVAPYASVLALMVTPAEALANLRQLQQLGARGRYGFIEALDFSPARRDEQGAHRPVPAYMAHHQGMSLLALCNLLCAEAPRRWFERHPCTPAYSALLHERMPREVVVQSSAIPRPAHPLGSGTRGGPVRVLHPAAMAPQAMPTLPLGNGAYGLCVRPNGAGQSRWRGLAINRTRDDVLRDGYGHWLLLRSHVGQDLDSLDAQPFYSITQAPCPHPDAHYLARFYSDHAEWDATTPTWTTQVRVWVSPEDDVELRQVTLHNSSGAPTQFELWSFFEAALAEQRADESHPAFSSLFVRAHSPDPGCLVLQRKPRSPDEPALWVAHFLASCHAPDPSGGGDLQAVSVACQRAGLWVVRGTAAPVNHAACSIASARSLDAELDTGLDPAASLRVRVQLQAHARTCVVIATAAAEDVATLMAMVDEYRQDVHVGRSRLQAESLARLRDRELRLDASEHRWMQDLLTRIVLRRGRVQSAPEHLLDRRALWRFSISGDRPLVLVTIHGLQGLPAVRGLLTAQRLWAMGGVVCDVVILNTEAPSYLMPLQRQLAQARDSVGADPNPHALRGGVYVLHPSQLTPADRAAFSAHAQFECVADGQPLEHLLALATGGPARKAPARALVRGPQPLHRWPPPLQAMASSGFTDGGRAYDIRIDAHHSTPRPWANVIANPVFGCLVTESGGGYTWAVNSRMNPLTPWSNDPLLDLAGEHFWAHPVQGGEVFGLLPTLDRNARSGYRVTHRAGASVFAHQRGDLAVQACIMVHPMEAAKCVRVRLHNQSRKPMRLRLVALVEWVMGAQRRDRMTLQTEYVGEVQAVLARQLEHEGGLGQGTAFLMWVGGTAEPVTQWTCDRAECFNAHGQLQLPVALGGRHGFGLDPCGALATEVNIEPGACSEGCWVIGYGASRSDALALAQRLRAPGELQGLERAVDTHWDALLSPVTVRSPDPLFDALVNRWLLYQTLSCRLWAKAGFYQASGATGFRDQLQDAMALAASQPALSRAQLLLHASRQFEAGDVQHWWHPPTGVGVRSRCSDDLLWLADASAHHCRVTGQHDVLDVVAPFLQGDPVPDGSQDLYAQPTESGSSATLFEHTARAIDRALRLGKHGLPLMGAGDWNDGMNRVGHLGRGESVWLALFLQVILRDWIPLARDRGETDRAQRWEAAQARLASAIDTHGWDGAWFRRAYFDDGQPLGSELNTECRIDLIAQAWSVFALGPAHVRAATAMQSADALLVDRSAGLVRLLHPPLQHTPEVAGYIQAYPPGVRENGGHYAHAAVWALMAQAQLGQAEKAWEYFRHISPAHRASTLAQQQHYGLEPYVMAGDICSQPPFTGRGGWSWYTGSAGWMYRAAVEHLLGLRMQGQRFCLLPCLPADWCDLQLNLQWEDKLIRIQMYRGAHPEPVPEGPEASRLPKPQPLRAGQWVHMPNLPALSLHQLDLDAPVREA